MENRSISHYRGRTQLVRLTGLESLEKRQLLALSIVALPAQDVTLHSARIGAEILDPGGPSPELSIYWGDEDGGTTSAAWDHVVRFRSSPAGQYWTDATELSVDSTYYYRAFALSLFGGGAVWTDVASWTTLPPGPPAITATPAALVTGSTVELAGTVSETGGDTPRVTVYYGRTDGGDQATAWEQSVDLGLQVEGFAQRLVGLVPSSSYFFRYAAANAAATTWTATQQFTTQAIPALQISEFMAANGTVALSRTRQTAEVAFPKTQKAYDWIELQNSSDQPLDLGSYSLTDNRDLPLKWQFPAGTTIAAHGFLVVYASGEDVRDPALDEQGRLHTNFQLSSSGEYLALSDGAGRTVSGWSGVGPQFRDVAYGTFGAARGRLRLATPGAENAELGPLIADVNHVWAPTDTNPALVVTSQVSATYDAVAQVTMHYRAMYADEFIVAMLDDGQGADVVANDGIYSAAIPGDIATAGQMIRYYVSASSTVGLTSRAPTFVDPVRSPEYYGTLVPEPGLTSNLPILHRFVPDPRRIDTGRLTRSSVFFDGEFYDNTGLRIRGGTAREWPKKSYKIEFNDDHQFQIDPSAPRVDEIDINATYTDKSYLRARLMAEFQVDSGTPSPQTYHLRMHQNGAFFSLALLVEQPDRDFLRRFDLDPEGSLYKAGPGSYYTTTSAGAFEKKTRDDDDKSDLTALFAGLKTTGTDLQRFLFDNIDLPAQINLMATNVVAMNIDGSDKNHFVYRDTNGTGEWQMLPWDLDLTFGPDALNTDTILADQNTAGATYPTAVHPFLGNRQFPLHAGKINMLLDGIIADPRTREMFLRRVRTLADEYLGSGYFHQRLDELSAVIAADVALDRAAWGTRAHFGSAAPAFEVVVQRIKERYLDRRYPYLTEYHVTGGVGIPQAQPADVTVQFGSEVSFAPASERPGDEFFTLQNPQPFAVDLSGWRVEGATTFQLEPGTVIGAGDRLYLTRDVAGFRSRTVGPSGNQGLFVQGYRQELPNQGGELRLLDPQGRQVATTRFGTAVDAANATNLRISEINYHPLDGLPVLGEQVAGESAYEFVELTNVSDVPIELAGVQLRDGVDFTFTAQILAPGQPIVIVANRGIFASRYGAGPALAQGDDGLGGQPGEFARKLSNSGDSLEVLAADGQVIQQLTYGTDRGWPNRADGFGSSLEWIGGVADPQRAASWRASTRWGGTPGYRDDSVSPSIRINEVLSRTSAPQVDQIELFNASDVTVDISSWLLTDDPSDLPSYRFAGGTTLAAQEFRVLTEQQLGFALNGDGESLWLLETDAAGKPQRFADFVTFGGTQPGESLGRWPDGQGTLLPLPSNSFGQSNQRPVTRPGDFNGDGLTDQTDLDMVCAALRSQEYSPLYDLDTDQDLDQDDLTIMVRDVLQATFGDTNLDGQFDSADLVRVLQAGVYEDDTADNAAWETGDWNCDGDFTTRDLVLAFIWGNYRP